MLGVAEIGRTLVGAAAVVIASASFVEAQTVVVPAVPSSLGAIADGASGCVPGPAKDVRFQVTGVLGSARTLSLSVTMTHTFVGDLRAVLIAPSGETHTIFARTGAPDLTSFGDSSDLSGTYRFADWHTLGWWSAAAATSPTAAMPPGDYRTSFPAGSALAGLSSFISVAFASATVNGTWTLRLTDECGGDTGSISGASLTFASGSTSANAASNSTGAIADGGPACGVPGAPRDLRFDLGQVFGEVDRVWVDLQLTHTFVGHLRAYLLSPDGASHLLFGRTGASTAGTPGDDSNLNGLYAFTDQAFNEWWTSALNTSPNGVMTLPTGTRTSELGGLGATGAATSMNPVFAGASASGVWTVRIFDDCAGDVGTVSGGSLNLNLRPYTPPTSVGDAYAIVAGTPLVVGGAGVLGNDVNTRAAPAMQAVLVSPASHGTLVLQPSGAFTYTPAPGFVGADSFAYAAANAGGAGNTVTVSLSVTAPLTVQPPTALRVDDVTGHTVRLRWDSPSVGPLPTGYLLEGGVQPGQPLVTLNTGLAMPVFTFEAPAGSFFVRLRAVNGVDLSAPSNEVPLHVAVPAPPSAPAGLLATVSGSDLVLGWRNTFGGAPATGAVLDVSGTVSASLPIGPGERFVASQVPAGTYALRVRSVNAAGSSAASGPVTVMLPNGCTGAPETPVSVLAYRVGSTLELLWEAAASGAAAAGYVVDVSSAIFTGSLPMAGRRLSAPVPAGSYTLRVAAANACGTSAFSPAQTVVVP